MSEEWGDPGGQRGREGAASLGGKEEAPWATGSAKTEHGEPAGRAGGKTHPKKWVAGPREKQVTLPTPPTPPTAHPLSPLLGHGRRQAWI